MAITRNLEYLMDVPLYVHLQIVPPLLQSVAGDEVANEYHRRVSASQTHDCPDIGFLNTIRFAKKYLEDDLDASESEAHYLALITMADWKKDRGNPEVADSAFDGPMSEKAYGEDSPMTEVARQYNKDHGFADTGPNIHDSVDGEFEVYAADGSPSKDLTLEHLMGASPLEVLLIFPAMLGRVGDGSQGQQLVDRFYEQAQAGDYEDLYRLTFEFAVEHLANELVVTEDADHYLALTK